MLNFKEQYNSFLNQIENRLFNLLKDKEPKSIYEPFDYILKGGGKRVRPVLTMICSGLNGGNPSEALDSACAMEILHNFTLVHDDIMDRSNLRRGRETIHIKWSEPIAILTGDIMVGYAFGLLPNCSNHERSEYIKNEFVKALIEVCEGQAYDMDFNTDKNVSLEKYLLMIEKKTSRVLEACATIGGHIAKMDLDEIENLRKYANNLGIAFQIQDDWLDISAEQNQLGKKIGNDILEGKKTYLIIKAKELAKSSNDVKLLDEFYQNNGMTEEYIPEFFNLFKNLGIIESTVEEFNNYFKKALDNLVKIKDSEYKSMLEWLVTTLMVRKF
ncbi:MAG: polyprenyl synthetase family protein [Candidatus Kapabacteria bacterium]|nr:polyprenyl synthetase family protein [Candidatus Kapabacteria bacterium]